MLRRLPRYGGAVWMVLAVPGLAAAQAGSGRVLGRVVSGQTGEPLPAVQVTIPVISRGTLTDANGRYILTGVPEGSYEMVVQSLGYARKTITGVEARAGQAVSMDVALDAQAVAVEGITISAAREQGSTTALLSQRQRASMVVDALGAEQISQTPDGDAAAALRRVPGVSVVDGKFIYVRGLGERYGATTLNGTSLPSPVPDRKAVPLDIIPSSLLESVVTAKTYSPDQPGDYAGGLVQIETRSTPTARTLRFSSSLGFTSGATLDPGLSASLGSMGFLGFGGGVFDLPAGISRDERASLPSDPRLRQTFVDDLTRGAWGPEPWNVPFNGGFGFSFGDELEVGGLPLGLIATASYSSGVSQPEGRAERFFVVQGETPSRQVDFDATQTAHEATLGSLLSLSTRINDTDIVTGTVVYNRLAETQARILAGTYESQGPYLQQTRVQHTASSILNSQLRGQHVLAPLGGADLRWRVAYTRTGRDEPGTRSVVYRAFEPDAAFLFFNTTESGLILHQELVDDAWNPGVDLKIPFTFREYPSSVSLGGAADVRRRDVYTRRLRLVPNGSVSDAVAVLPPDELFAPERIGSNADQFRVEETTFAGDNYDGELDVFAGYAMADVQLLPRLRMVAGTRVEQARLGVAARDQIGLGAELPAAELDNTDILPAVNLTYELRDGMNLRLALSRTVARPQFRELAPYLYVDYFGGFPVLGNPNLTRSSIVNSDVRWEWFWGLGSLVSLSGFHKSFDDPIEPFALVLGTNPALTYANSDRASLYGLELELRSDLGPISAALENLSANVNVTLVESSVAADSAVIYDVARPGTPLVIPVTSGDRALFGQSPYVVNLGLTYARPESTSATLLFNRFGRRLDAFGGQSLPDIYEQARSQLDLAIEQPLVRGVSLKFTAGRLLGNTVRFAQTFPNGETVYTREYDLGRSFSLGLSWEPRDGR